ncbi:MAG: ATP-binding protein [Planctomycetes bacterium]|nr:ATP-binding protein [Planctomycetota bacterium]
MPRTPKLMVAMALPKERPDHVLVHAVQGWGKTSLAAQAPSPVFLMTKNETGLLTLIQHGQLPPTPWLQFPRTGGSMGDEATTWLSAIDALTALLLEKHQFQTLCLDTLNGLERLCHEYVCATSYDGDWSEKGFLGFQRGYETSLHEWRKLLNLLDLLRDERGIGTFAICHTQVKTQANPLGRDYDRFIPNVHKKTWDLTHGWCDLCLFGRFEVEVVADKGKTKGKGRGGSTRMLYTSYTACWDAKNRHGLPDEIVMGDDPRESWQQVQAALCGED